MTKGAVKACHLADPTLPQKRQEVNAIGHEVEQPSKNGVSFNFNLGTEKAPCINMVLYCFIN